MIELNNHGEPLRQTQDIYQKMIDEVQDYAILLIDRNGIIQNWNRGAQRIKGYTVDEIVGKSFKIFYTPEDVKNSLPDQLLREATQAGRASHEGWRVRKDKSIFWGSIVITALHDENGNIFGFTKVTRDLTERKSAEEQLRQYAEQLEEKNKELEQFAYVASHDLREPLRKIIAFGDMARHNFKTDDVRAEEYIQKMQGASKRMMSLIDDLLSLTRISNEKLPFEKTDLNKVIADVKEDLESIIEGKNVVLSVDTLPVCDALPAQMHQLFQNLISNSIKFNDKKVPKVHISCEAINEKNSNAPEGYRISVIDNGIGFSDEYKERIFEIFHRIHGRAEYAGAGIGLAICKKILDVHHGSISADAVEGKGATFTVILPAQQSVH
jgi:PAS domain S-box-containing protein